MDLRKYFMERMYGRKFIESEYEEDNQTFYEANPGLGEEIAHDFGKRSRFSTVISVGGGKLWYEKDFTAEFVEDIHIWNLDKRCGREVIPQRLEWIAEESENEIYFFANVLHCLENPVDYFKALPKGTIVVVIDTFMAKPNSDWQLFFNNYMREINGTGLPHMAQYESLPGFKCLAKKQNHGELDLGYVILRKVI